MVGMFFPDVPEPDPIKAVPANYLPDREQFHTYTRQLWDGLQTLVQGPLDYRLYDPLDSWNGSGLRVQQREFDAAARLVIAALDAGPRANNKSPAPLAAEDWGSLASACLAGVTRDFTRPLAETSRKMYVHFWESVEDNPQRPLEDGENPEFHSLLQRLKATSQHLDIHINADKVDGMRKWTTTVQKEIEEMASQSAGADVELSLYNWKTDQLTFKQ
jgi:hypothetical protein